MTIISMTDTGITIEIDDRQIQILRRIGGLAVVVSGLGDRQLVPVQVAANTVELLYKDQAVGRVGD